MNQSGDDRLHQSFETRVNSFLVEQESLHKKLIEDSMKSYELNDWQRQEQIIPPLSQSIVNSLTGKLELMLKNELRNTITPGKVKQECKKLIK